MDTVHGIWCDGIQTRKISDRSDEPNNFTLFYVLVQLRLTAEMLLELVVVMVGVMIRTFIYYIKDKKIIHYLPLLGRTALGSLGPPPGLVLLYCLLC